MPESSAACLPASCSQAAEDEKFLKTESSPQALSIELVRLPPAALMMAVLCITTHMMGTHWLAKEPTAQRKTGGIPASQAAAWQ